MKRRLYFLVVFFSLGFFIAGCASDPGQKRRIGLGTFGTGGVIYTGGAGVSIPLSGDQSAVSVGPASVHLSKVDVPQYMKSLERELYVALASARHKHTVSLGMPDAEKVALVLKQPATEALTDASRASLDTVAASLTKFTNTTLTVNTGDTGKIDNAQQVVDYLQTRGIENARLSINREAAIASDSIQLLILPRTTDKS